MRRRRRGLRYHYLVLFIMIMLNNNNVYGWHCWHCLYCLLQQLFICQRGFFFWRLWYQVLAAVAGKYNDKARGTTINLNNGTAKSLMYCRSNRLSRKDPTTCRVLLVFLLFVCARAKKERTTRSLLFYARYYSIFFATITSKKGIY